MKYFVKNKKQDHWTEIDKEHLRYYRSKDYEIKIEKDEIIEEPVKELPVIEEIKKPINKKENKNGKKEKRM